ncbi:F-box-like protein [Gracilaria domingensis]|nr:F-box-like protein [Gracilaria domingensis]
MIAARTAPKPWLQLYQTDFANLRSLHKSQYKPLDKPALHQPPSEAAASDEPRRPKPDILSLPGEILSAVCSYLDAEHLAALAQVNSALMSHAYDPKHWRRIARHTWPFESDEELQKHLYSYKTWRLLCTQRPRLRTNGLFVLKHQFTKTASRFAASEPQAPVFLVTYHRFLRFYSSGTVVGLTTPEPPHLAYRRVRDPRGRGISCDKEETRPVVGTYTFDESRREVSVVLPIQHPKFPQMRGGDNVMEFTVTSTVDGAFDRLHLINHFAVMDNSGDSQVASVMFPSESFVQRPFRMIPLHSFRERIYREFPRDDAVDLAQWYEMKKAARAEQRNKRARR